MFDIDKVMCLCIPSREKEREELEKQIIEKGWDYQRFIVGKDYIDDMTTDITDLFKYAGASQRNCYNCFKCHQTMIKIAKKEKRNNLLMLEDDAYITDRFDLVWNNVKEYFADKIWFTIHFGWWIGDESDIWNKKIEHDFNTRGIIGVNKMISGHGWHGTLVNNLAFDWILDMRPTSPLDVQACWAYTRIPSYYIIPRIIHTKTIMSSCCNGEITQREKL